MEKHIPKNKKSNGLDPSSIAFSEVIDGLLEQKTLYKKIPVTLSLKENNYLEVQKIFSNWNITLSSFIDSVLEIIITSTKSSEYDQDKLNLPAKQKIE